jgi:hypothetical protein
MADYNLTNEWSVIDQQTTNADTQLTPTLGNVLYHANGNGVTAAEAAIAIKGAKDGGIGVNAVLPAGWNSASFCSFVEAFTDSPTASGSYGVHIQAGNPDRATQFLGRDGEFWARSKEGGVWSDYELYHTGNANNLTISTSLSPSTDNNRSLGEAAKRYSVVYAGTGTINTSDGREKGNLRDFTTQEIQCAKDLSKNVSIYQWLESIEQKGADNARLHVGMYVQDAISVFESHNLDPMRYGLICYDSWEDEFIEHPAQYEQVEIIDNEGNGTGEYKNGQLIKEAWTEQVQHAGDRYGFRYDQLTMFILRGLNARLEAAGI